jgi:tetratricopeptide (TPR) repeat protein
MAQLAAAAVLMALPQVVSAANPVVPADYDACVGGAWPTVDDAEARSTSCSKALQSGKLSLDEVANARLTRGVARYILGETLIAGEDYQDALRHYSQVIDPQRPDALLLYRRGVAHEGMGETDKALEDFTAAIKAAPERPLAYLERGVLLATRMRSFERAIADLNRTLELDPRNVTALIVRGTVQGELAQFGRAIADFDSAIRLAPRNSEAFQKRALARSRLGQDKEALDDYAAALRINPQNAYALTGRAGLEASRGQFALAIADLDAAIKINPGDAAAFYNRGYGRFAMGDYDRATEDYGLAIALDPRMSRAYANRCLVRAIVGRDLVRALDDCDTALKLAPLNLDIRATRGFVFLKLGDPQLALNEYNAVLERDPNRALALYGRGLALIGIGKKSDGERERAAGLALDPEVADSFSKFGLK